VPSKALLAAAEARQVSLEGRFPGISVVPFGVDAPQLLRGKRELVASLRAGKYVDLAAEYGWDILAGSARFATTTDGPVLRVDLEAGGAEVIEAEHYLIATGSTPWAPPIGGLADAGYLTSTTAIELEQLLASMLVLGGNAVGLEQAQLWNRLGVDVTVVEAQPRLAPFEEPELSVVIEQAFRQEGIRVVTDESVYLQPADTGNTFRVSDCYYIYNLAAKQLSPGTYEVAIVNGNSPIGTARCSLA